MLYPAELIVYCFVLRSKVALPGTAAVPISDWPSKIPMGVSKCVLARRKSAGGATWVWVAEPGCAQAGTVGAEAFGTPGRWANNVWVERQTRHPRIAKEDKVFIKATRYPWQSWRPIATSSVLS